jgi:hypothetical protein
VPICVGRPTKSSRGTRSQTITVALLRQPSGRFTPADPFSAGGKCKQKSQRI